MPFCGSTFGFHLSTGAPQRQGSGRNAAPANQRKWRQFSGLFLLLRERITLSRKERLRLIQDVAADFAAPVCPTVRTYV